LFFFSGLFSGLSKPSTIAVAIALTMNLVLMGMVLSIDTHLMASIADYFADNRRDYDLFATRKVFELQSSDTDETRLVVLGGSTTQAVLLERELSNAMEDEGLSHIPIVNLCTSRQTLWDAMAFLEMIPASMRTVVVLGMAPGQFTAGVDDLKKRKRTPRFGFYSQSFNRLMRENDLKVTQATGIYVLDNKQFLFSRLKALLHNLLYGPPSYFDSYYLEKKSLERTKYVNHSKKAQKRFKTYEAHWESNQALLESILNKITNNNNMEVVIFEAPVNPDFLSEFELEQLYRKHQAMIHQLALENGITYLNANELGGLEPKDFYDWAHVSNRNAVNTVSKNLVQRIGHLVRRISS
jgi:hypothetical protein